MIAGNSTITLGAGSDLALSGYRGETYLLRDCVLTGWTINHDANMFRVEDYDGQTAVFLPSSPSITAHLDIVAGRLSCCDGDVITQQHIREYSVLDLLQLVNERIEERAG